MASSGEKLQSASSGMAGYYDSNIIQTKKIRDKFYICGDFEHEAKEGEGLMAPRVDSKLIFVEQMTKIFFQKCTASSGNGIFYQRKQLRIIL